MQDSAHYFLADKRKKQFGELASVLITLFRGFSGRVGGCHAKRVESLKQSLGAPPVRSGPDGFRPESRMDGSVSRETSFDAEDNGPTIARLPGPYRSATSTLSNPPHDLR